ncbi:MAG: SDR family oxidoreductase [Puia sp.]|nr:SDR family oxidoreductase [Puia sp.]
MIAVTGATGQFGRIVIQFLLRKGFRKDQIAALTRNEEKPSELKGLGLSIIKGDYDDYASLVGAFTGVNKLLFVPGRELRNRLQQNENVINAAREAGVHHVVYASFERKNETDSSPLRMIAEAHLLTEKLLKESGLTYTVLKNNLYMDLIPDFIGKDILQTGTIYLPAGDGKVSAALRSDMAGAAAEVLISAGHENKVYDITNTEAYSYADIAKCLSEITGKTINYISPAPEEFAEALRKAGVSPRVAEITMGFALAQEQGDLDMVSDDLANLIKRKPVSLKDYLKHFYQGQLKR